MTKDFRHSSVNGVASVASTQCTNDQQWTKYHSKQGHGFAAEDANAMWDRWHGENGACPPTRSGLIHPLLNRKTA